MVEVIFFNVTGLELLNLVDCKKIYLIFIHCIIDYCFFFILKVTFSAWVWSFLNGSQGSNLQSGNLPYIKDMQKGGEENKLKSYWVHV